MTWDTTTTSNGLHTLSARALDTAGNPGITSGVVTVTVANSTTPTLPEGLMAGYGFSEGSLGTTAEDVTGNGNTGTLVTWADVERRQVRHGDQPLDGVNDDSPGDRELE